jgi:F-type H+-transporting ATPase subunit b
MGGFGELIQSLHIDGALIIAQTVNFLLLLLILTRLVYRPLIRTLNQRREKIEASLQKVAEIEEEMAQLRTYHQNQLAKANTEAQAIIEQARTQATEEKQATLDKTKADIEELVARAHRDIDQQKEDMLRDAQLRLAEILVPALEAVLRESVDTPLQQELMAHATRQIQKSYQ